MTSLEPRHNRYFKFDFVIISVKKTQFGQTVQLQVTKISKIKGAESNFCKFVTKIMHFNISQLKS